MFKRKSYERWQNKENGVGNHFMNLEVSGTKSTKVLPVERDP